jgi:hypothetical protein
MPGRLPERQGRRGVLYLPRDISDRIANAMLERIQAEAGEFASELADLAHRDPEAFGRAWREGIARICEDVLDRALAARAVVRTGEALANEPVTTRPSRRRPPPPLDVMVYC